MNPKCFETCLNSPSCLSIRLHLGPPKRSLPTDYILYLNCFISYCLSCIMAPSIYPSMQKRTSLDFSTVHRDRPFHPSTSGRSRLLRFQLRVCSGVLQLHLYRLYRASTWAKAAGMGIGWKLIGWFQVEASNMPKERNGTCYIRSSGFTWSTFLPLRS